MTPTTVFNASQNVTIQPHSANEQIVKLTVGSTSSKEYFRLSNRQKTGFDSYLPGEGLTIGHIDDNQANNTDEMGSRCP